MTNKNRNLQAGQTLLFVVVMLTIALAAGVGVSVNTISSLSRTSQTDTASRVHAAAEAGIERLLVLSSANLSQIDNSPATNCSLISGATYDSASGKCLLNVTPSSSGDAITSAALLDAAIFSYNETSPSNHYAFNLKEGDVKEVSLNGYAGATVKVCWTPRTTGTDLFVITYSSSGIQETVGLRGNASGNGYIPHNFRSTSAQNGYNYCSDITSSSMYGIRIRSLKGDSRVAVFPSTGNLPSQGYMLESTGYLTQDPDTKKRIVVYKSYPYASALFDFSVFANEGL